MITPNPQLPKFLASYPEPIIELTMGLRNHIIEIAPNINELIWDNYNALAMAYSTSEVLKDAFCHIAVYAKHINLGFNRGTQLNNNSKIILEGNGKLIRHLKIYRAEDYSTPEVELLVHEALHLSETLNPNQQNQRKKRKSIVMSISEKKRRPL